MVLAGVFQVRQRAREVPEGGERRDHAHLPALARGRGVRTLPGARGVLPPRDLLQRLPDPAPGGGGPVHPGEETGGAK
eukprot:7191783-Pyramimonas_sp.AAC.1